MPLVCPGQQVHKVELSRPEPVLRDHLDLGGRNPQGETIAVNSHFIERAGRPFIPVVGELHYARVPVADWGHAIRAMKAGGITVVATYVFWNLHEREEDTFDWTGNLDLRRFVTACAENGVSCIVRLGPFCHGEMRNGGLPDWLYGRSFEVRSNDPAYLEHVDRLYAAIADQIRGLLYKDGGPVIGVQLENEYQHSAAPWDITYKGAARELTVAERDLEVTHAGVSVSEIKNQFAAEGREHMATLKRIARKHGMDVPLYTATGWGNAAIVEKGSIPVTAGYPYPFWAPAEASPFYLYKDIRRQPDYMPVSYDTSLYPSVPAEIGPGIMPTYARRPRVPSESVAPMIVRTIGSGSNGIGYYMYHGGSTPVYGHFFNEQEGGLPKINYDFQAPIGEFGQLREHYHALKPIHLFLASFGDRLALMQTTLPASQVGMKPSDTDRLRFAVRSFGSSGFVFMHQFQDHLETEDLEDQRIEIETPDGRVAFPHEGTFTLKSGTAAILPFNFECEGVTIQSATVQPMTRLTGGDRVHYVFRAFDGIPVELVLKGSHAITVENGSVEKGDAVTIVRGADNAVTVFQVGHAEILVLPQELALQAWRVADDRLWFTPAGVSIHNDQATLVSTGSREITVHTYPRAAQPDAGAASAARKVKSPYPRMDAFEVMCEASRPRVDVRRVGGRKVAISVPRDATLGGLEELLLEVDYVGDRCMAFIEGHLVADHFFYGEPWQLGLGRFLPRLAEQEMVLVFHPIHKDQTFLQDLDQSLRPQFADGANTHLAIGELRVNPVYRTVVPLR